MLRIEPSQPLTDARWATIAGWPDATLYHSVPWIRVLTQCYGFRPHYQLALDGDEITAALPACAGGRGRRRLISLPFSDVAGPIGSTTGIGALLAALRHQSPPWRSIELRGPLSRAPEGWTATAHNDLYTVALDRSLGDVVRGFSQSVRWGRNRALREGVTVARRDDLAAMREFYRLHQITRRKLGVPVQAWRFFAALWREFVAPGLGFVVQANHGARAIASAVFLRHGTCLYYKFSASDPAALAMQPYSLVLWEAITHGHELALAAVDLGKTVRENAGLARFKRSWGATATPLPHYYYPQVSGVGAQSEDSARMRAVRAVWRRLPLPVARVLGPLVYRRLA